MILIKENEFLIRENDLKMRYNASPNFETSAINSLFYTRQTQNNSHSCKQNTTFITQINHNFMTKRILVTLLTICCFSNFTNAQIKTSSVLLGGQIGYYSSDVSYSGSQPNEKNNNASFNISIGKALKENSVYGLNLTYSPVKVDNFYNGANYISSKLNQYNLGIFYRKYKKLGKDFYFYTELGASYIYMKETNTDTLGTDLETIKQSGGQIFLT